MNSFDKYFSRIRGLFVLALLAWLAVFGSLVWLAVLAINTFS